MSEKLQALFSTEPRGEQIVQRLLDAGDHTEPGELCNASLISLCGKSQRGNVRELVLTAEEMTSLSRQWLAIAPGAPIKIDFELLTQQKAALFRILHQRDCPTKSEVEHLEGILSLLDAVQDLFEPVTA